MNIPLSPDSRLSLFRRLFLYAAVALCFVITPVKVRAHQSPTTIALLDVSPDKVTMELQMPLPELELAFGHGITKIPETLIATYGPQLKEYLLAHIHPYVTKEQPWNVAVTGFSVGEMQQPLSGPPFRELTAYLVLTPPSGVSTRKFTLDYDVILHQVITHVAYVSVRNDWAAGRTDAAPVETGAITWNTKDNVIYPFQINLEEGSWWKGFGSMVSLGEHHIAEGTDHLLFLLTLLLPAPLIAYGKKWGGFGGTRYSIVRLLKIVTAFTIGHSVTLLLGSIGWLRPPAQPIEIAIAFSILVSSFHALRPLFPGKEMYIAAGFGLIHGMAFASTLANLNLGAGTMALSILGFNVGIELMQLFVIALIVPWLIILSKTGMYKYIRTGGALLAWIAATAWMAQRITGDANVITDAVESINAYAFWIIGALALLALSGFFWSRPKRAAAIVRQMEPAQSMEEVNN